MKFDPSQYKTVAERVQEANQKSFEILETKVNLVNERWGFIQTIVKVEGKQYIGTASFRLDLVGSRAQATCPIEDAETSAWGRALAAAGFSSSKSIASLEEIQEAQRRAEAPPMAAAKPPSNVVVMENAGPSYGEMVDEIVAATKQYPEALVLEFLRHKKIDIGDAKALFELPKDAVTKIHDNLEKFKKALSSWGPK